MTYAATEAALSADLMPLEGVESVLVRLMARAAAMAEACFERAEAAQTDIRYDTELRLGARLGTLFTRTLGAFHRHRAQVREEIKTAVKDNQQARFDQVLHLAALADAAVARKAKGGATPAGEAAKPRAESPPEKARPLSRQQRRAAERRLRKAGGVAQGP